MCVKEVVKLEVGREREIVSMIGVCLLRLELL